MKTYCLDSPVNVTRVGRKHWIDSPDWPEDRRYRVGSLGVAWVVYGPETEPDEDTEWSGLEVLTGRVVARMVGDDRPETFDPSDLVPIGDLDYCAECGQMGCTHDGRERGQS